MDVSESGLPNIRIKNIGTILNPLKVVEARIILEAWDGYLYKHRENGREITDKKVRLYFDCFRGNNAEDCRAEINAYHHLLKNQSQIRDSIIRTLREKFDWLKEIYEWGDDVSPEARDDFDFKPFIGPLSVSFHEESKDDIAYLEWHFQCEWDPEHGLAVITHEDRVIDLDQGETDIWKIYKDKGTFEEELRKYNDWAKNIKPRPQKPWWQFW